MKQKENKFWLGYAVGTAFGLGLASIIFNLVIHLA